MLVVYIVLGVIVLIALVVWATYNSLVRLNIKTDEALSDITVQMKRRLDLIPNLVKTVKGYAKHEKSVFENVTKARTSAMAVPKGDLHKQAAADNQLSSTLKSLFAVAENYPDLKANENFQASRRFYNGNVRDFNTKLKVFPTNVFGNMLGFKPREFFDVEESEKAEVEKAPKVDL